MGRKTMGAQYHVPQKPLLFTLVNIDSILSQVYLTWDKYIQNLSLAGISLSKTGHCGIFALKFFYEGSKAEIFMRRSRNPEEAAVKISDQGAQYFFFR